MLEQLRDNGHEHIGHLLPVVGLTWVLTPKPDPIHQVADVGPHPPVASLIHRHLIKDVQQASA
jgi:hypothetical protein